MLIGAGEPGPEIRYKLNLAISTGHVEGAAKMNSSETRSPTTAAVIYLRTRMFNFDFHAYMSGIIVWISCGYVVYVIYVGSMVAYYQPHLQQNTITKTQCFIIFRYLRVRVGDMRTC